MSLQLTHAVALMFPRASMLLMASGKLQEQDSVRICYLNTALPHISHQIPQDQFHRNADLQHLNRFLEPGQLSNLGVAMFCLSEAM